MEAGFQKECLLECQAPRRSPRLTRFPRTAALEVFLPTALKRPEEAGLQLALGLMPVPHGAASGWGRGAWVAPVSFLGRFQLLEEPRLLPTTPEGAEEGGNVAPLSPKPKSLWIES